METSEGSHKHKSKKKKIEKNKRDVKWIIFVFIFSFITTMIFSVLSNELIALDIIVSFIVLLFFVSLGILTDIIGLSIATAREDQFHSMASRKIKSAKHAIKLIRNAEKMSSFFNDIIGDICGILSGATGTVIVVKLFASGEKNVMANLLVTALIASLTVGGKAFGKSIAISNSNEIVNLLSKIIYFFKRGK